jgi:hypothetical protein
LAHQAPPNARGLIYRSIALLTCTADHSPSLRGVEISRALSSAAIARSEIAPVACMDLLRPQRACHVSTGKSAYRKRSVLFSVGDNRPNHVSTSAPSKCALAICNQLTSGGSHSNCLGLRPDDSEPCLATEVLPHKRGASVRPRDCSRWLMAEGG